MYLKATHAYQNPERLTFLCHHGSPFSSDKVMNTEIVCILQVRISSLFPDEEF